MNWTPDMQRWAVATPYVLRWTEGQLGENNFFISSDPDKSKAILFHKDSTPSATSIGRLQQEAPRFVVQIQILGRLDIEFLFCIFCNSFHYLFSSIQVNYIQKGECYDISESKSNQF